jgi:lipoprotein-anchoring transpeptidase ErfK/SrfK
MRNEIRLLVLLGALLSALFGFAAAASADDGVGVVDERTGEWFLRDPGSGDTTSFYYGNPRDVPFVGDWDCDGDETPGLYRQGDGYVYLRNSNTQGNADLKFFFGNPGDVPIAGDWNGDGCDTVSIYRPSQGRFYIINHLGSGDAGLGAADLSYTFGNPGDKPFAGDFDGDGTDTVGVYRSGSVYLSNVHAAGGASAAFAFGGDSILASSWTGGADTVGSYLSAAGKFALRHSNTAGAAEAEIEYGNSHTIPIAGDFGSLPGGDEAPPSPPPYPDVGGSGKRLIYSNSGQRVWWIDENDNLVDTYLVTGRKGIPPPGTYTVFSKSAQAYAPYGGITMKWMVRFVRPYSIIKPWDGQINQWSYGFHGIPIYPDETQLRTILGTFGSGGCVRQPDHKAEALFNWTPVGTTVYVLP